jgi:hypothetical protein
MLVNPRLRPGFVPGLVVQRATASEPTGPWAIEENILFEHGSRRDWDENWIALDSVVRAADGYHVYYGSNDRGSGLMTSPDGITWTKYNDPETDQAVFRNSDPVFGLGETDQWDEGFVNGATVWLSDNGWEMVYFGGPSGQPNDGSALGLGYATSEDGITWTRQAMRHSFRSAQTST